MNPVRKRRLIIILSCLIVASLGIAFILVSLNQNINLFLTPSQVVNGEAKQKQVIRVGGLVVENSVQRGSGTMVSFQVTDTAQTITVQFDGILPDLFSEGQAVVVKGSINHSRQLVASEVLAKHDENYVPVEAAEAIMQAQKNRQITTTGE